MADLASLRIPISADLSQLKTGFADARRAAETAASGIEKPLTNAAARSEREWLKIQKAMDALGPASSRVAANVERALTAMNDNLNRSLRAIEGVESAMARINRTTGVTSLRGSFGRAEDIEAYGSALDDLRAKYNPLFAMGQQYKTQLAEIRQAEKVGALTRMEAASAIDVSKTAFARQVTELNRVTRATGFATHEISNLRSQAVDIGTMFSMGASPFQIISSQAGQIYEVLANYKGGVSGALSQIGKSLLGLISPTTLAIGGLSAAVVAVRMFGDRTEENMKKAEKAAEAYTSTIARLRTAQGSLAGAAGNLFDKEMIGSPDQIQKQLQLLGRQQALARKAIVENLLTAQTPGILEGLNPLNNIKELFRMGTGTVSGSMLGQLAGELARGERTAESFRDKLLDIRLDESLPKDLQEIVDKMLEGAQGAIEAEARIKAITEAIREQKREIATTNYRDATEAFQTFVPDRRSQAEQIEEAYRKRLAAINSLQDNPRSMEGRRNAAEADRLAALKELQRQEDDRRAGYELDIRVITARTAAEKAAIAAERERIALADENISQGEKDRRIEEARTLSLTQSQYDLTEATRQRIEAGQAQVDQANLELGLVGKSAAETATLRAETELLTAAKRAAAEAGTVVGADEIAAIKSQAAAIGEATAALEKLNFQRDLRFRVQQAGRSPEEQRIVEEVKGYGETLETANGQAMAAQLRYVASVEKTADELQNVREIGKDAFLDIVDALGSGENAVDSLIGAFASLGKQLASLGAQKLFDGIFGDGAKATAGGLAGIGSAIGKAANQNAPAYSAGSLGETYAAPLGKVTRGELPPIATGAGFDAGRARQVANQTVPAQMWSFFESKGLASHQIAGILGNAKAESAFNPSAVGDAGMANGLFQWNDRGPAMKSFVGSDWKSDVSGQLDFAWKELQTSESKAYQALLKATNVTQATEAFLGFERPSGYNTGVKNSHNYGGRVANANEVYSQYGGQNVASSTNDTRGLAQTQRTIEKGTATGIQKGLSSYDAGGFDSGGSAATGLFSKNGLSVVGAGAGAFGAGYQSGSPLSGGVSGALGGYQAGGAISGMLGIGAGAGAALGVVGGAALGILGGILGARAEREAKHREAQAAWEEQRPAYEQFDRSLSGEGNGQLREMISGLWGQLNGFMQTGGAAWKYGEGNSSEQFESTGTKMWTKVMEAQAEFREGFTYMLEDLSGGEGLEGAFAKGRGQVKALDEQIKGFIDDVSIAFISSDIGAPTDARWNAEAKKWEERRNAAIEQAKRAAGDYALTLLYTADAMSDVQKAIDSFRGTAAGLQPVLVKLGWSAEEAATAIAGKLNDAISAMGKEFVDGFQREINSLSGIGYLDDVKDLLKDRDTALSDATLLGVDPTVVTDWFKLAAQDIVDGSELTGSAFDGLIAAFPQLAGVVKSFTESVEASADAIKARSLGYQDRLFTATTDTSVIGGALSSFDRGAAREREEEMKAGGQAILDLEAALAAERLNIIKDFNDRAAEEAKQAAEEARDFLTNLTRSIKEFTDGLRSGAESPLAPKDRLAAAQSQYDAQLALVKTGDRDAANGITGYASDLIEANKAYNASSPAGQAITNAIIAQLEALPKQVSAEQFIVDAIKDTAATQVNVTAAMQEALRTAFAAGPQATAAALSSSFSMLDTSLDGLLDYNEMRAALTGIATDAQVRTMMNVLDSNGDGQLSKLELITASNNQQVTQLAGQNSVLNAINAATQSALGNAVALYGLQENHRNISLALLQGQQLSNARGFMTGGYTGDGPVNAVAGVVHGQEGVLNAGAMRALGRPTLDAMNRGQMRTPIAMPMMPQMANDNGAVVAEVKALREEVAAMADKIARATVAGAELVHGGVEGVSGEIAKGNRKERSQHQRPARAA